MRRGARGRAFAGGANGSRSGHQVHSRSAAGDGRQEGVRPVPDRGFSTRLQARRQHDAGVQPESHGHPHPGTRAGHHERPPGLGVRAQQGMQLRHQPARHRALPGERVRAAGARRAGAADDQHDDPADRGSRPARDPEGHRDDEARPRDPGGRDGLRQVDLARRDDRLPQREQSGSHHHHRGPHRVRARAPQLRRHAA